MAAKNQQWIIKHAPGGIPELGKDIELLESAIPEPKDGEFLVQVLASTTDPCQISLMGGDIDMFTGEPLTFPRVATSVHDIGRIIKSKNNEWKEGTLVRGRFGWQLYAVSNGKHCEVVPSNVKATLSLGALGMLGATAYFGLLERALPKEGETILISGAAGGTGSLVGQMAKIKGLRVIGTGGGPDKVEYLKSIGFDAGVDYRGKTVDQLAEDISAVAPKGVDIYYENTGGDVTKAALKVLNPKGRVIVCGQMSGYNSGAFGAQNDPNQVSLGLVLLKQLNIQGFVCTEWKDWSPAVNDMRKWIAEGKIKAVEDIEVGIDKAFDAFLQLFNLGSGKQTNTGKKVIVFHDDPVLHIETTAQ